MRFAIIAVLATGLMGSPLVHAQTPEDPSATLQVLSNITTANDFVNVASLADKFEIDAANLAQGKTNNDNIRRLARHFLDDQSKAGPELRAAAKAAGMAVTPQAALDARQQDILNKLTEVVGGEFDAQYVASQIQLHEETLALFTSYAAKGDNAELKAYAEKMLPTVQQHLEMAKAYQPK
jgi:putative membrane protein